MAENQESIEDVKKMISNKLETIEEEDESPIDGKFISVWAAGLAVFSFSFLCIGSFLFGATATTSVLRGLGGAILFGASLWLVGTMLIQEENPKQ